MSFSHIVGHKHIPSFLWLFERKNEQILPENADFPHEGLVNLAVSPLLAIRSNIRIGAYAKERIAMYFFVFRFYFLPLPPLFRTLRGSG